MLVDNQILQSNSLMKLQNTLIYVIYCPLWLLIPEWTLVLFIWQAFTLPETEEKLSGWVGFEKLVWSTQNYFVPFSSLSPTLWTWARTQTHIYVLHTWLPLGVLEAGWVRAGSWVRGAVPGAIWQRHTHLHNVVFYLISHSKCNQKLMRAPSCFGDWQHDSALTPYADVPHPNDAILKPSPCSYTNPTHNSRCVSEREGERDTEGKWVSLCEFIVFAIALS